MEKLKTVQIAKLKSTLQIKYIFSVLFFMIIFTVSYTSLLSRFLHFILNTDYKNNIYFYIIPAIFFSFILLFKYRVTKIICISYILCLISLQFLLIYTNIIDFINFSKKVNGKNISIKLFFKEVNSLNVVYIDKFTTYLLCDIFWFLILIISTFFLKKIIIKYSIKNKISKCNLLIKKHYSPDKKHSLISFIILENVKNWLKKIFLLKNVFIYYIFNVTNLRFFNRKITGSNFFSD